MATMAMSFVPSDSLKADLYGSTSEAYRTRDWIAQGRNHLRAWYAFGRLNRVLDDLFSGLYKLIEDAQDGHILAPAEDSLRMKPEEITEVLWKLHNTLDSLCVLSVRKGFRRKPLLKNPLATLEAFREQILDMIQWVDECSSPERLQYVDEVCAAALDELHSGDTITVG